MHTRTRKCIVGALALVLALGAAPPARAHVVKDVGASTFTTDVPLVTTAETVVVSSDLVLTPFATSRVIVIAWAQLTTGTATTAVTPRIRRGTVITGTLLGEATPVTVGAAAGSTEQFYAIAFEERQSTDRVQYSFTLQQTAASANGSALQGGIVVLVL